MDDDIVDAEVVEIEHQPDTVERPAPTTADQTADAVLRLLEDSSAGAWTIRKLPSPSGSSQLTVASKAIDGTISIAWQTDREGNDLNMPAFLAVTQGLLTVTWKDGTPTLPAATWSIRLTSLGLLNRAAMIVNAAVDRAALMDEASTDDGPAQSSASASSRTDPKQQGVHLTPTAEWNADPLAPMIERSGAMREVERVLDVVGGLFGVPARVREIAPLTAEDRAAGFVGYYSRGRGEGVLRIDPRWVAHLGRTLGGRWNDRDLHVASDTYSVLFHEAVHAINHFSAAWPDDVPVTTTRADRQPLYEGLTQLTADAFGPELTRRLGLIDRRPELGKYLGTWHSGYVDETEVARQLVHGAGVIGLGHEPGPAWMLKTEGQIAGLAPDEALLSLAETAAGRDTDRASIRRVKAASVVNHWFTAFNDLEKSEPVEPRSIDVATQNVPSSERGEKIARALLAELVDAYRPSDPAIDNATVRSVLPANWRPRVTQPALT